MNRYTVWFTDEHSSENDGQLFDAPDPEKAALCFAEWRFSDMQHLDPGEVFVRDINTRELTIWRISHWTCFSASQT